MTESPEIAIVGMGNVGWNLARRFHEVGFHVPALVSKSMDSQDALAGELNAVVYPSVHDLPDSIDLTVICSSDDAVREIEGLIQNDCYVVHTSGSTPILDSNKRGVFYPFQTFTKGTVPTWEGLPIFIESNDEVLTELLFRLGKACSGRVEAKDSEQRRIIHLAGVFGANFVNHILHLANEVLKTGHSDFSVLEPLIQEVIRKATQLGPAESQTGPARRGDLNLIAQHLESLEGQPEIQRIYKTMSQSIRSTYPS